jgi:methyl-accepting chemotaxis protein
MTAAQEQKNGANEQANGIVLVSSTIEELSVSAKQITQNIIELVTVSGEIQKMLTDMEKELLQSVKELSDAQNTSMQNTKGIVELGKRSTVINEMVDIIKDIANKTNILSINASIEASHSGQMGAGFAIVAAEIRELSKETIVSAKNVEKAAIEIGELLDTIIKSSENEFNNVKSGHGASKKVFENIKNIIEKINANYSFTKKIDTSIKQQEIGSKKAAETMRQMIIVAKQSAEVAKQTADSVQDIVRLGNELNETVPDLSE